MRISLDRSPGAVPLYKQIAASIRAAIENGRLPAGTKLPATRELSAELGVNRLTADAAYSLLEAEGLVEARRGSGTYALPLAAPVIGSARSPAADVGSVRGPAKRGNEGVAVGGQNRRGGAKGRAMGVAAPEEIPLEDLSLGEAPAGMINFASGACDPRLFPAEDFRRAMRDVMRRDGVDALGYGDVRGYGPLRATIAGILASQGIAAGPEEILVTAGSQQAVSLAAQALARPGDAVAAEEPCYAWALELFRASGLEVLPIPADREGMRVDLLEKAMAQAAPAFVYTVPNFQNPSGACMDAARRRRLVALAEERGVVVVEDDFVGELRYEGHAQPALKALDRGGRVVYVGSFSKMLMPGLRAGYLAAGGELLGRLARRKRLGDIASSGLIQRALAEFVTVGRYRAHLRRCRGLYRARRDAMAAALASFWPLPFDIPRGGLFFWLRLPEGLDSGALLRAAVARGVSFMPGTGCFQDRAEGARYLRLNFAAFTPAEIGEGMGTLREVIEEKRSTDKSDCGWISG